MSRRELSLLQLSLLRLPVLGGDEQRSERLKGGHELVELARLEWEHRQKAETGMAELKTNFGVHAFRKHGFMANWAWLLIVCLRHNLCCWVQYLGAPGGGRAHGELRAKRLRYRYLNTPAMLVRNARRLTLRLSADYLYLKGFLAALGRLRGIRPATA